MRVDPQKDIVLDVSSTSSEESDEEQVVARSDKLGRSAQHSRGQSSKELGLLSFLPLLMRFGIFEYYRTWPPHLVFCCFQAFPSFTIKGSFDWPHSKAGTQNPNTTCKKLEVENPLADLQ